MKNTPNLNQRIVTMSQAKDFLIKDIQDIMGVEVLPQGGFALCIDSFIDFMEKKEIYNLCSLDESLLGSYRIFLRVHSCREAEVPLVHATGALLAMSVSKGFIDKDLVNFWDRIADPSYFENMANFEGGVS